MRIRLVPLVLLLVACGEQPPPAPTPPPAPVDHAEPAPKTIEPALGPPYLIGDDAATLERVHRQYLAKRHGPARVDILRRGTATLEHGGEGIARLDEALLYRAGDGPAVHELVSFARTADRGWQPAKLEAIPMPRLELRTGRDDASVTELCTRYRGLPVHRLDLRFAGLTPAVFSALGRLASVHTLSLGDVSPEALAGLATVSGLAALELAGDKVGVAELRALGQLAGLRRLTLLECRLTDEGAAALAGAAKALVALRVDAGDRLTATGLRALAGLARLEELSLAAIAAPLGDADLAALCAGLPSLRVLSLPDCRALTDAGLAALAPLKALRTLTLYRVDQLTEVGARTLADLSLESLELTGAGELGAAAVKILEARIGRVKIQR